MAAFSAASRKHLAEKVHPDLIRLFTEVVKHFDCTVLGGVRTPEDQDAFILQGLSKTKNSKHLPQSDGLAHAVDVAPYPLRWDERGWQKNQIYFAGFVKGIASQMGIAIRWGGDWKSNNDPQHNGFEDLDHFELAGD